MVHSTSITGIVMKRTSTGEADRVVTLFSKEMGKVVCIAKGCRKLTSSKLSMLEPGNEGVFYLVMTKSLPILTQVKIVTDRGHLATSLSSVRRLFEVLEILDALLPEGDAQPEIYHLALLIMSALENPRETHHIRPLLYRIVELSGFADQDTTDLAVPVRDIVEHLTQTRLYAHAYLHG